MNVNQKGEGSKLVTVDGETDLELETLLKASAYILGTSGSSIVYKAVLENGTAFAVRRIGESSVGRLKDFESQIRMIAKLKHPNLVKIRGFYWGDTEKLVIYDYVSNGSLSCTTAYGRSGSSSLCHLPLKVRIKIARGVARGLAYIHEKKQVHGNIKPSNILLDSNMEPLISDLGLDHLVSRNGAGYKPNNSSLRFINSQRSTASRDGDPLVPPTRPSPHAPAASTPYQAQESLKSLKPNPKWDVYSFDVILLELLSGRVLSSRELVDERAVPAGSAGEETDTAIKGDMEGKVEAIMTCFRLGFSCTSVVQQQRPSMKEAVQILEKIASASSTECC
ncbi:Receptor protein kinase-like protein [Hibiscus syriacus]|uniref:Receptor protein kinase-like protein n=1 Tax=Hibiscus syriacus TaxID=106335 RepID=A0A6A2WYW8_HIBSY|nr:Receptor protein kinase-like protein [Hibiscus syriacus]